MCCHYKYIYRAFVSLQVIRDCSFVMAAYIVSIISVTDFILNSTNSNKLITYLISLDLHRYFSNNLTKSTDQRYVEIAELTVKIHDGPYKSIEYKAVAGKGYKLPKFYHYDNYSRRND